MFIVTGCSLVRKDGWKSAIRQIRKQSKITKETIMWGVVFSEALDDLNCYFFVCFFKNFRLVC